MRRAIIVDWMIAGRNLKFKANAYELFLFLFDFHYKSEDIQEF